MTVTVKHAHQTALPNDGSKDVSATAWNEAHTITLGTGTLIGRATAGTGAAEEITLGTNLSFAGTTLNAAAGSAAGSSTEIQYRNAGAFGAMSGTAWNDTNRSLTITGATVTTSNPVLNLSQTWNAGAVVFTALLFNVTQTAASSTSKFLDFQSSGVSRFAVDRYGGLTITGVGGGTGPNSGITLSGYSSYGVSDNGNGGYRCDGGGVQIGGALNGKGVKLGNDAFVKWSSTANWYDTPDLGETRNAAGVKEINNGTAGTFRDLKLRNLLTGGGNGSYVQTPSMTVANLAAAATAGAGARAFVTDATSATFAAALTGGGTNKVPCYSDGTNWFVG